MLPTGDYVLVKVNTDLALLSAHLDVFANAYKIIPTQTPTIVFTFVFANPFAKIKKNVWKSQKLSRLHFGRRTKNVNTAPSRPTNARAPTSTYRFTARATAALPQSPKNAHFFHKNRKHTQAIFHKPKAMKR